MEETNNFDTVIGIPHFRTGGFVLAITYVSTVNLMKPHNMPPGVHAALLAPYMNVGAGMGRTALEIGFPIYVNANFKKVYGATGKRITLLAKTLHIFAMSRRNSRA